MEREDEPVVRRLWLAREEDCEQTLYWVDFILPFDVEVGLDIGDKQTWSALLKSLDGAVSKYQDLKLAEAEEAEFLEQLDDYEPWESSSLDEEFEVD